MMYTPETTPTENPWKAQRRAKKVDALVSALDGALDASKILLPEQRLDAVAGMGSVGWASASAVAGVNLPSVETRWEVVRRYEARVRASLDAQIASDLAKALRAVAV